MIGWSSLFVAVLGLVGIGLGSSLGVRCIAGSSYTRFGVAIAFPPFHHIVTCGAVDVMRKDFLNRLMLHACFIIVIIIENVPQ